MASRFSISPLLLVLHLAASFCLLFSGLALGGTQPRTENRAEKQEVKAPQTSQPQAPRRPAQPRTGEECNWRVMASGGGVRTIGSYTLGSTIGQPPVGLTSMGDYTLHAGFWQNFGGEYLCGDTDGSGTVNIADAVYLLGYIFGGPAPEPLESADVDCSGGVNSADVVYLIGFIFGVNPNPCDPDGDGIPDC